MILSTIVVDVPVGNGAQGRSAIENGEDEGVGESAHRRDEDEDAQLEDGRRRQRRRRRHQRRVRSPHSSADGNPDDLLHPKPTYQLVNYS